jgi:hypothetical protein
VGDDGRRRVRSDRACLLLLAGLGALGGCHRTFTCEGDEQCSLAGVAGRCEPEGFCSFADDDCPSGRRFGEHATSSLVETCVDAPAPDASTGEEGSASGPAPTGSSDEGAGESTTTSDGGDCPPLADAEPIVVTRDAAVIERVRIFSDGQPAIRVDGAHDVTIRDVEIHHQGAPGILFAGSDGIVIRNAIIIHDGAPASGPHRSGGQAGIEGRDATGVVIEQVRVVRGSSGVELDNTPAAHLSFIEGIDVRGPGSAAFVRLHESDEALLEDFSVVNPLDTGRPQTLVQISASSDAIVRRGLLDGHNAQYGYGVGFALTPGQHSGGLVEDVDAVRMTSGGFTCFPWGRDVTFRRTRARDNICEIVSVPVDDCDNVGPNGGCVPGSNGVSWTASTDSTNIVVEQSAYFDLCAPTLWPAEVFTIARGDLVEDDFIPRAPITVAPCWAAD